ncbi:MAG: endonuclease NucS [Candidatus Gracilibacteria bacterium]|jgi:restriction system protein|nr:endonuclease NucS [Candidatus Gracilibacteria bacterium]
MKKYYRIMLGQKSVYAEEAYKGNFIGIGWFEDIDLTHKLPENWREFNKNMIPLFLNKFSEKGRVSAGLACGFTHTVCKGIKIGDIVICPNGQGSYYVGEVTSNYEYHKGQILPHRRRIEWYNKMIERTEMSDSLRNSSGSIGTVSEISQYADEIDRLISGESPIKIISTDDTIEDPSIFALEKHLEDFLVNNWKNTELSKEYDIFEENGELVGQQFPTDTGPIDILAISKTKKKLLVVELKKGRASDVVVGQIQRYMGFVQEELAEKGQEVHGIIIALEEDLRLKRALTVTKNIEYYSYKINFKLIKNKA